MESTALIFIIPVLAVILDSIFGDPKSLPHPVRYIGKLLDLYEASARRVGFNLRAAGWIAVFLFGTGAWALVVLLMHIPFLGVMIGIYFAFAGLALGCLMREARKVASLLDSRDLEGARHALSMLVSRDTRKLDAHGIRRTLAETVSENLNDGFVAPLFYLVLFGPGGLWAYKTISTMDSMWGYRTARFKDLGQGAAKTDDLLAFIPARLTAYFLLLVGRWRGLEYSLAKTCFKADARKMESPNAGWPMAATAWLLGGQMGGPTVYFGKIKDKPILGPVGQVWDKSMIRSLILLCQDTGRMAACALIPILGLARLVL